MSDLDSTLTAPQMGRSGRHEWLMKYIQDHGQVDVLHSDFVDDYTAATGAKFKPTCWGAYKCPTLGKDLAHMARCGALKRGRIGLSGNWQPGFPKWVWAYSAAPSDPSGLKRSDATGARKEDL